MIKKSLISIPHLMLIFCLLLTTSSCVRMIRESKTECVTCSYVYDNTTYNTDEICGTEEEIDDIIDIWMTYESSYDGIDVTCI